MMQQLSQMLSGLNPMLEILGKLTILLIVGWGIHGLLRGGNPRWRILLWRAASCGIVLIPLLVLLAPKLTVPVPIARQDAPAEDLLISNPQMPTQTPMVISAEPSFTNMTSAVTLKAENSAKVSKAESAPDEISDFRKYPWLALGIVWAGVALGLFALTQKKAYAFRRIMIEARPAPESAQHLLHKLATDLNCKCPAMRVSAFIPAPILFGVRQPVILLPSNDLTESHELELTGILAHELSHLRSNDLSWTRFIQALSILLWFHPLVWGLRRAHDLSCELVCDRVASDAIGNRGQYTKILADMALAAAGRQQLLMGLSMARQPDILFRLDCLRRKIQGLPLRPSRKALALVLGGMLIASVTCIKIQFVFAQGQSQSPAPKTLTATYEAPATIDRQDNSKIETVDPANQRAGRPQSTITGQVVNLTNGDPVPYMNLLVVTDEQKGEPAERIPAQTIRADDGGKFIFSVPFGLPYKLLWLSSNDGSYIIDPVWLSLSKRLAGSGVADKDKMDLALKVKLWRTGSLAGKVLGPGGKPVRGVRVHVHSDIPPVFSDGQGRFTLKAVPLDYDFDLVSDNASTGFFRSEATLAGRIHLQAGTSEATLPLEPVVDVICKAITTDGRPAPNMSLAISPIATSSTIDYHQVHAKTGADGTFTMPKIHPRGIYTISWAGLTENGVRTQVNRDYGTGSVTLDLGAQKPGVTPRITVKAYLNALLGKVVDEHDKPLSNAQVLLLSTDMTPLWEIRQGPVFSSDKNGNFAIPRLAPGHVKIQVSHDGYQSRIVESPSDSVDCVIRMPKSSLKDSGEAPALPMPATDIARSARPTSIEVDPSLPGSSLAPVDAPRWIELEVIPAVVNESRFKEYSKLLSNGATSSTWGLGNLDQMGARLLSKYEHEGPQHPAIREHLLKIFGPDNLNIHLLEGEGIVRLMQPARLKIRNGTGAQVTYLSEGIDEKDVVRQFHELVSRQSVAGEFDSLKTDVSFTLPAYFTMLDRNNKPTIDTTPLDFNWTIPDKPYTTLNKISILTQVFPRLTDSMTSQSMQLDVRILVTGPVSTAAGTGGAELNRPWLRKLIATQAKIADGRTITLGSISGEWKQQMTATVPFLGKLPILGEKLFTRRMVQNDRVTLVLLAKCKPN